MSAQENPTTLTPNADLRSSRQNVFLLSCLLGFGLSVVFMETRFFQRIPTGGFFSVVLCLGLLSWALRLVRSRKSQFSNRIVLGVVTFAAAMSALGRALGPQIAIFAVMVTVCWAMTSDLGILPSDERKVRTPALRSLQVFAGLTGLAHVARVLFHGWFASGV